MKMVLWISSVFVQKVLSKYELLFITEYLWIDRLSGYSSKFGLFGVLLFILER